MERSHKCPGCNMPDIPNHRMSCGNCWRLLPERLRRRIGQAWRDRHEASAEQKRVIRESMAFLRERTASHV